MCISTAEASGLLCLAYHVSASSVCPSTHVTAKASSHSVGAVTHGVLSLCRQVKTSTIVRNYKRIAEAWLDGYKEAFYRLKPDARTMDTGQQQKASGIGNGGNSALQTSSLENHCEGHFSCAPNAASTAST
eukprot:3560120-Amphidinium_carterae.2